MAHRCNVMRDMVLPLLLFGVWVVQDFDPRPPNCSCFDKAIRRSTRLPQRF
jgi:hypothetical protein